MSKNFGRYLGFLLMVVLALASLQLLHAQDTTSIVGTVTDSTGAAMGDVAKEL